MSRTIDLCPDCPGMCTFCGGLPSDCGHEEYIDRLRRRRDVRERILRPMTDEEAANLRLVTREEVLEAIREGAIEIEDSAVPGRYK